MIIKQRDKPYYLLQLQSLEKRLSSNHPKKEEVKNARINELTGIQGERKLDFPLGFLCRKRYRILHQLRLQDNQGYFRIDSLILHQNYFLILEVKNWFGNILFGPQGQVTRINDHNEESGFPNPIQQVKLQQYRLRNWLDNHGFPNVPMTYLVVIAQPRTILKRATPQDKIPEKIIHTNQLLFELKRISDKFKETSLSQNQLVKISILLKQQHIRRRKKILKKFQIHQEELVKGVVCPKCQTLSMRWELYKPWYCVYCHYESHDAHIDAINDYILLIDDKVTNKQMRQFLLIDSANTMKYIFQKKRYKRYGNTRGSYYKLTLKNR